MSVHLVDVGASSNEVVVERRAMPRWTWLLMLLPVIGWLIMFILAMSRTPEMSTRRLDVRAVDRIDRIRAARGPLVGCSAAVLAVGVVGRVIDADWAPPLLAAALLGVPIAWFLMRVAESKALDTGVY